MSYIREIVEHFGHELKGSKICCPFHEEDTPSLHIYEDTESWYCWGSCQEGGDAVEFIIRREGVNYPEAVNIYEKVTGDVDTFYVKPREGLEDIVGKEFNLDINEEIKSQTGTDPKGYRGLREDITKRFGVRFSYKGDGSVDTAYFPTTKDSELSGYKVRQHPKRFLTPYGETGQDVDLFGQFRFKTQNNILLIVGGEYDMLASYQMLFDNQKNKQFDPIAVVSSTIGEAGAYKQIQNNYEFVNSFKKIVVAMDNDAAGREAIEKIVEVLPKGKVHIMHMRRKDPNSYIWDNATERKVNAENEFISDFWAAKPYTPDGVKSAMEAFMEVPDEVTKPRISLPPYMHKMQDMMGGGIIQGRIFNIIADTSSGKSTHINRMVYHWIFNSPVTPTIVTLEATAPQYALEILSIHIQKNVTWSMTGEEIIEFLETDEGRRLQQELCFKENGEPRFYLIDERSGDIKSLEQQVEILHNKHGCKLFIFDVLTDCLRGSNEQHAEDHMNFQKNMVKNGVTIGNVLHTRKPPQNADGKPRKVTEYDALGTGSFVQSAAYNIVLNRDKLAEDDLTKNTTEVSLPKCRGGKTGEAGSWYYEFSTVQCYDLDDYLGMNPDKAVNF